MFDEDSVPLFFEHQVNEAAELLVCDLACHSVMELHSERYFDPDHLDGLSRRVRQRNLEHRQPLLLRDLEAIALGIALQRHWAVLRERECVDEALSDFVE